MPAKSPKAVRTRSRSPKRSPLLRSNSNSRIAADDSDQQGAGKSEPLVSSARTFSPLPMGKQLLKSSPSKAPRRIVKERSVLSQYLTESLPAKLSAILSVVILAVAAVLFFGEGDGPKLVKRDAPLVPGDRLKGGQYISFCTSIIATGCKPKHLELGVDGSLGVYGGTGPHARKTELWSAGTGWKNTAEESLYELLYTGGKAILTRDGKVKWSSPMKSLPKHMQPWPFAP